MWKEITPEREKVLIEKIARNIVKYDMEAPGLLLLQGAMPFSHVGSQMTLMMLGIYLPENAADYILLFEKRANIEEILTRIEELKLEKKDKEKDKEKSNEPGVMERLKKLLGRSQ